MAEVVLYMACPNCNYEDEQLASDYEAGLILLCEKCGTRMETVG